MVYYNENNDFAVAWLKNLIKAKLIADGEVDDRSIELVRPEELRGYAQCHFFAGIGVWSYALRQAGWPDDRGVWTGSCPCQPFSAAGKGEGFSDPRHLWPVWFNLIRESRPVTIFGEQVDKALDWLDLVSGNLESENYAVGTAILGAHSVGAPHIRQRLYWVADSQCSERGQMRERENVSGGWQQKTSESRGSSEISSLANSAESRRQEEREYGGGSSPLSARSSKRGGISLAVGNTDNSRPQGRWLPRTNRERIGASELSFGETGSTSGMGIANSTGSFPRNETPATVGQGHPAYTAGFWADCDWLACIDGKARPVEPSTFPLVNGTPSRVGRLRGYGNAIVAPQAQAFIEAYITVRSVNGQITSPHPSRG